MDDMCYEKNVAKTFGPFSSVLFCASAFCVVTQIAAVDRRERGFVQCRRRWTRVEQESSAWGGWALSLYSWTPRYFQQNFRSRRLTNTSVVQQTAYFWQKSKTFSKANKIVDYYVPREMNTTVFTEKSQMSDGTRLLREEWLKEMKRDKSGFKVFCIRSRRALCGWRIAWKGLQSWRIWPWMLVI